MPIAKVEEPTRLGRDGVLGRELWVCLVSFVDGGVDADVFIQDWIDDRVALTLGENWQSGK